ncbi:hypothetical protein [Plantibacter sp. M259]|uniref:hypothetical protein n=1 Tax=Plantibacter sp. M259 TaxID=2583822 RepID=UPI00143D326A|nr:hypothetical protein [Plantibacter sp. M259]
MRGFVMRYSLDLNHYFPRCSSCHRLFDNAQRKGVMPTIRHVRKRDDVAHFNLTIKELA